MIHLRLAVLAIALALVSPVPLEGQLCSAEIGALAESPAATTRTTTTEYVVGFKNGVQPPFNKVVLAKFPPGTPWSTINAFVAKAKKSGLYSSVIVTPFLPPG